MEWLRSYRPDLVAHYEELYARGAYVNRAERERISALLRRGPARRSGPALRDPGRDRDGAPSQDPITMPGRRPPPEPAQTKLF
jgi:hypothetical protein